jgi:hypothetical protein
MRPSLKVPLVVAAVVVVGRVVVEQLGYPGPANAISEALLAILIFPAYFAVQIARSSSTHPYKDQFKVTALYAALARAMVIPTYWLAYKYQWQAPRFGVGQGGVVARPGEYVDPITAFLTPLGAFIPWVLIATIVGGGIGAAIIALKRRGRVANVVSG